MIDGQMWCLEHVDEKYKNPAEQCVRYGENWICSDRIHQTWITGGCIDLEGWQVCGNDFYKLAM